MVWEMGLAAEVLPELAAAVLMIGLAAWLLYLDFGRKAHRALSLLLFFRAGAMLTGTLATITVTPEGAAYWWRILPYLMVPAIAAAVYFASVFPRPRGWFGTPLGGWALVVGTVAVETAYLFDHSLAWNVDELAAGAVRIDRGPLSLVGSVTFLVLAHVALVFARDVTRLSTPAVQRSLLLLFLGFGLNAVHDVSAAVVALDQLPNYTNVWATVAHVLELLIIAPIAAAAVIMFHFWRTCDDEQVRMVTRRVLTVLPLPLATGVLALVPPLSGSELSEVFLTGLWRLAFPIIVVYALVKHQLFGVDLRLRFAVRQSTMATIFIAVFFIVSEGASVFFGDRTGNTYLGIAVAALLLFALAPIQRLAGRVAERAVPEAQQVERLDSDQRLHMYRRQVEFAWSDGQISAKERRMLDAAKESLGLTDEEARMIEIEVLNEDVGSS